jgi:hypothetical protein
VIFNIFENFTSDVAADSSIVVDVLGKIDWTGGTKIIKEKQKNRF